MISYEDLVWSSDWNGDEVGYPEVDVVGLYMLKAYPSIHLYLDTAEFKVLEMWYVEDEE